jgi:hypothetical protein
MKSMTCKQLGGACDERFSGNTFDEMAEKSKAHGAKMFELQDEAHFEAMHAVMAMMEEPEKMRAWLDAKRAEFDALPDDE